MLTLQTFIILQYNNAKFDFFCVFEPQFIFPFLKNRIRPTATTMSEPPRMTRPVPRLVSSTTRVTSAHKTQAACSLAPLPVEIRLPPAVQFPPARCQDRGQGAMIPAHLPGCPTPPMLNSTPLPELHRVSKRRPTQRSSHLEITLGETVVCLTAQPSFRMTTMDTPPSTPPTAWASLLP